MRRYESGKVVELVSYPVGNAAKPRKRKCRGATTPRKQEQNDRYAERQLARSLNCNFGPGDLWITLTYSPERLKKLLNKIAKDGQEATPDIVRSYAIRERDNFIRRVKAALKKDNIPLKYIAVTSDMDGKTGEVKRIHHHIVMNREARKFVTLKWSEPETDIKHLRHQDDYTAVAKYLLQQVRKQPDAKKYSPSRNLKKPKVTEKIITMRKPLKAPRGAEVMAVSEYDQDIPVQYLRYIKPETKHKQGGKRE